MTSAVRWWSSTQAPARARARARARHRAQQLGSRRPAVPECPSPLYAEAVGLALAADSLPQLQPRGPVAIVGDCAPVVNYCAWHGGLRGDASRQVIDGALYRLVAVRHDVAWVPVGWEGNHWADMLARDARGGKPARPGARTRAHQRGAGRRTRARAYSCGSGVCVCVFVFDVAPVLPMLTHRTPLQLEMPPCCEPAAVVQAQQLQQLETLTRRHMP